MTSEERAREEERGSRTSDELIEHVLVRYEEYIGGNFELPKEMPAVAVGLAIEVLRLRRVLRGHGLAASNSDSL